LVKALKLLKSANLSLQNRIKYLEENQDEIIKRAVDKATQTLKEEIIGHKKQIEQLRSVLNNDGINFGFHTSMTLKDKQKNIPNSGIKTGKKKDGQSGHAKYCLPAYRDEEITQMINHKITVCHYADLTLMWQEK